MLESHGLFSVSIIYQYSINNYKKKSMLESHGLLSVSIIYLLVLINSNSAIAGGSGRADLPKLRFGIQIVLNAPVASTSA